MRIVCLFLAVFILTTVFFFDFAQASLWDTIRAWVTINPLEVKVSAPTETEINKVFKVEARAINKGEEKIENAKGEIFLPEGLVLLKKDSVQELGVIPGKKEKKISWSVKGEEIGSYIISVSVSGELKGEIIRADDSIIVKIGESLPSGKTWGLFQELFDFFQKFYGGDKDNLRR